MKQFNLFFNDSVTKYIFFYTQSRPYLSEVTACQVFIGTFHEEHESINYADNKGQFEKLLHDIEKKGDDPIIFIRDEVLEKHISGNHQWHIKEKYRLYNSEKFEKKSILVSYINPTLYWLKTCSSEVNFIYLVQNSK